MAILEAKKLASDLMAGWPGDRPFDALAVLDEHPTLRKHKSVVIDLALEEFQQRIEKGESLAPTTFAKQFSTVQHSLAEVLEVASYLREHNMLPGDVAGGELAAGYEVLGFHLLRELGEGGFSRVFLAREMELGNRIAVVKFFSGGREAEKLGQLRHAHIVPVNSVRKDDASQLSALCMPYLGQATLLDVLDFIGTEPNLPKRARAILRVVERVNQEEEDVEPDTRGHAVTSSTMRRGLYHDGIAQIGQQLAQSLAYTHRVGVRHADVKPSNVLVMPNGDAKLFDFNLSATEGEVGVVGGTLAYMAPENLSLLMAVSDREEFEKLSAQVGFPADVFSFGVTLYELLTNEHPFGSVAATGERHEVAAATLELVQAGAIPIRERCPVVPTKLARIVESCLLEDPQQRPTAEQVYLQLSAYLGAFQRSKRWIRRHPLLTSLSTLAIGLLVWAAIAAAGGESQYERQVRLIREAIVAGKYGDALELADGAIKQDAASAEYHFLRGRILLLMRDYKGGQEAFEEAYELRTHPQLANWIGYELARHNVFGPAAGFYEEAREGGWDSLDLHNNLGLCYKQTGKFEQARLSFGRAMNHDERHSAVWHNMVQMENRIAVRQQRVPNFAHLKNAERAGVTSARLDLARAAAYAVKAKLTQQAGEGDEVEESLEQVFAASRDALQAGLAPSRLNVLISLNQSLSEDPRFAQLLQAAAPQMPARDPSLLIVPDDLP